MWKLCQKGRSNWRPVQSLSLYSELYNSCFGEMTRECWGRPTWFYIFFWLKKICPSSIKHFFFLVMWISITNCINITHITSRQHSPFYRKLYEFNHPLEWAGYSRCPGFHPIHGQYCFLTLLLLIQRENTFISTISKTFRTSSNIGWPNSVEPRQR